MQRIYPLLFVFLWSTGFIGAKYGLPDAGPLSFLLTRYGAVILLMGALALATRAPWPAGPRQWLHIAVTGLLVHATYLGGVFIAIKHGLPAGVTALVVGLQPLLTATLAGALLGETVSRRQWGGLALGLAGVGIESCQQGLGRRVLPCHAGLLSVGASAGGRHVEREGRDRHLEAVAVDADAEVMPAHDAHGGLQARAAGVLEGLARLQQGLATDHAQSIDDLGFAEGILDFPVTRDQLGRHRAGVGDRDRVGKDIGVLHGRGLRGQVFGPDVDGELVLRHVPILTSFCRLVGRRAGPDPARGAAKLPQSRA